MFHTIPIKMPARIFVDMHKIILKLIWEDRGTITAKTILKKKNKVKKKKKNKVVGISLSDFKTYNTAIVIKTV